MSSAIFMTGSNTGSITRNTAEQPAQVLELWKFSKISCVKCGARYGVSPQLQSQCFSLSPKKKNEW